MMELLDYGPRALLIEGDAPPLALAHALTGVPGVEELVPAAATVLVRYDGSPATRAELERRAARTPADAPVPVGDTIEIPVRYDGADLDQVAEELGLSIEDLIEAHSAVTYTAAFGGFAAGFCYLDGVPHELRRPRLATPRPRVPARSVAVADRWSAVYPSPSPGGWHLLGTAEVEVWDPGRPSPALIRPGDRVRFVPR